MYKQSAIAGVSVAACCVVFFWLVCPRGKAAENSEIQRLNLRIRSSDVIARVTVTEDTIVRPPPIEKNGQMVYDAYIHGHLITLNVENVYTSKVSTTQIPSQMYVFQKGRLRALGTPKLGTNRSYVVLLEEASCPSFVRLGEVAPGLPTSNYYSFVDNMSCVGSTDTNKLRLIDELLSLYGDKKGQP